MVFDIYDIEPNEFEQIFKSYTGIDVNANNWQYLDEEEKKAFIEFSKEYGVDVAIETYLEGVPLDDVCA